MMAVHARRFGVRAMSSSKVFGSAEEALHDLADGQTLCVGGFGLCGIPGASRVGTRALYRSLYTPAAPGCTLHAQNCRACARSPLTLKRIAPASDVRI